LINKKLRIAWIIPNVFCYLVFLVSSTFVALNAEGLREINLLNRWVVTMIMLFFASVFGSYRIWTWIREGKM